MITLLNRVTKENRGKIIFLFCLAIIFLSAQAFTNLTIPSLMGDMVNKGMITGDTKYVLSKSGILITLALVTFGFSVSANMIAAKLSAAFGKRARWQLFEKIESFSLSEFDKIGGSSLITRITNDVTQIQNVLNMAFRSIIFSPIMMIGGIVLASQQDISLLWILVVSMSMLILLIVVLFKTITPLFKSMQKKVDKLNLLLRESLTGIRVIRAFNKIEYDENLFKGANEDLTDVAIKANRIMSIMQPIMMLITSLTAVAVVWFGAKRIATGNMEIGDMIAFMQYTQTILFSIIMISIMFVMIPRASASCERINEVLDIEPIIVDSKSKKPFKNEKGLLEFKNVTFGYEGADSPVIRNISFTSRAGETTALIGSTGSGKSTLINLIPRFYDVTFGEILIDGTNVKDISQKDLREKIGFVPQGPILFSGTVRENIQFGKKDASDQEIKKALQIAQAETFVEEMKDGYNSHIAQGGTNVSGGQRQRLSIARAVVSNPEIYIFDDSFSALDLKTDSALRGALKKETKNSTIIIVAQKVSTIVDADQIIVLDEGEIAGIGTHRELLNSCKVYKEIALSQLSEEELNERYK
ncbi:MAG: ABC transporter ATP-binding protein [Lachnospirales bacterium]